MPDESFTELAGERVALRRFHYLFTVRGKHRIIAYCDARSAASAAVLERLAMRREGHLRESTWAKGGWTDDLLYAVPDHEWQRSG